MTQHFLTVDDFTADELHSLFARTAQLKAELAAGTPHAVLKGKTLAMFFEKPSTRTRVSFEVAMFQLGGHALNLAAQGTQLGRGETYADTARVMSRYVDGVMIRAFEQRLVEEFAHHATVPVMNGLTDQSHPCQILADLFTVQEALSVGNDFSGLRVAWVGDGNNVCRSWIEAARVLRFQLAIATPKNYEPDAELLQQLTADGYTHVTVTNDPAAAVKDADVVNADTWLSMGQEGEGAEAKRKLFAPFQVNQQLMSGAKQSAIVLHCLPAHRGEEITDDVMDGPQSHIFHEAENRLHVQKALLEQLLGHPSDRVSS